MTSPQHPRQRDQHRSGPVLAAAELRGRPPRKPNLTAESAAVRMLIRQAADDPRAMLQSLAEAVAGLCHAGSAGVGALESGNGGAKRLTWVGRAGDQADQMLGSPMARENSPAGACLDRGEAVLVSEPAADFPELPMSDPPALEALVVPVRAGGRPAGVLWAATHEPGHAFDAEDLRVLGVLSDVAGVGLQLFRANTRLEQTATERTLRLRALASRIADVEQHERRRMAQVLHDHLQQLLVAARMQLGLSRADPGVDMRAATGHADELIRQSIEVSRSLAIDLCPPVVYDASLTAAMEWLGRQMMEKHRLRVEVRSQSPPEMPTEGMRLFVFQAARELLLNVVKHAHAGEAQLDLGPGPGASLRLSVQDHGTGFDPAAQQHGTTGGFGLLSIRERAELLGGRLELDSAPGEGSRVALTLPLQKTGVAPAAPAAPAPGVGSEPPGQAPAVADRGDDKAGDAGHGVDEGLGAAPAQASPGGTKPGRIRVLLADDHKILREGLAGLLGRQPDIEVVGGASVGQMALDMAHRLHPQVVVMDISMPVMNGIEATRRITAELPPVKVIGLSMHEGQDMAASIMEAGACDYVTKGGPAEVLINAIRNCVGAQLAPGAESK